MRPRPPRPRWQRTRLSPRPSACGLHLLGPDGRVFRLLGRRGLCLVGRGDGGLHLTGRCWRDHSLLVCGGGGLRLLVRGGGDSQFLVCGGCGRH